MKQRYLTPAEVRRTIRVLSNWPEVRRTPNVEAVGYYTDEVGAEPTHDDANDYEYQQRRVS